MKLKLRGDAEKVTISCSSLDFINISQNLMNFAFEYKIMLVTELFVFSLLTEASQDLLTQE